MASNSYSLDYWRKFFRRTNTNIFEVVENAVIVAATDHPTEFARRRDELVERMFTCRLDYRCWSDRRHEEQSDGEENDEKEGEEERRENKVGKEASKGEAPPNEVEEVSRLVSMITRIKKVLKNWCEESESVLLESLQRLQSMEISIQILKETNIGRTLKHLLRHESKDIRLLAQALIDGWRNVMKDWANEVTNSEDPAPDSACLAFPPWDEAAFLATQTTSIELTRIFDRIDDNGNIENCGLSQEKGRRRLPKGEGEIRKHEASSMQTRPLEACNRIPGPHYHGEKRRSETRVQIKPFEAPRPPKPYDEGRRRMQESSSVQQRPLEAHIRLPKLHELQKRNYKRIEDYSGPSTVTRRPPRTVFEHKTGAETEFQHNQGHSQLPKMPPSVAQAAPQKYDDRFLAQEKVETAKRKLQEGYQQAKNAKMQRTIQVVELSNMPKHNQNQRQSALNVRDRIMKKLDRRH